MASFRRVLKGGGEGVGENPKSNLGPCPSEHLKTKTQKLDLGLTNMSNYRALSALSDSNRREIGKVFVL